MWKKLITLSILGFLIGVLILVIICAVFNRGDDGMINFYSERFLAIAGSPSAALLLQFLVIGVYGSCCFAGTMLYEIEHWPLARATVVHYLIIAGLYPVVGSICRWGMAAKDVLIVESMQLVGFIIIWLIIYFRYKAEVRKLNKLCEQKKDARKGDDNNKEKKV